MKHEWYQGTFIPDHPEKCINKTAIKFRSSYEKRFLSYLDSSPSVIKYGFEVLKLPYIFEIDSKQHLYIVDFYIEVKNKDGEFKKYLVELKPKHQTEAPVMPKRKTAKSMKNFLYAAREYIKNKNKWSAAESYCKANGLQWKILNETNLF